MPSRQAIKRKKDKLRWDESKADRSVQLKAYYEENKEVILETSQTKYCNNPAEKRSSSRISGRAVATPYLGMTLVFLGFGRFQVSETAIKQT